VAVALGWDGIEKKEVPLIIEEKGGVICERIDKAGRIFKVVTKVDGIKFSEFWLNQVTKP
jgi:hypothetical protein